MNAIAERYRQIRSTTERLCAPLAVEDYVVQSMPEVSPTKWHLAHTTWFFETFVLKPAIPAYRAYHPEFESLFNSYYNQVGTPWPRERRGLLSRPTVAEVCAYRRATDEAIVALLTREGALAEDTLHALTVGLNHEQQHQELILMDAKHVLSLNPLEPVYRAAETSTAKAPSLSWFDFPAGLRHIGHDGPGFAFDNERPRHPVYVAAFGLAARLVTNREYLGFVEDGGYMQPAPWLADGWATVQQEAWEAPLYWRRRRGAWHEFTLAGATPLALDAPVAHLSYYEADAYATWAGARLPTEAEWEVAAAGIPIDGNFLESATLHPQPAPEPGDGAAQLYGDLWEWTASAYAPYPGFRPFAGALGEYNGKFMSSQQVLRGGSCVTPRSHIRLSYRNFFAPGTRWHFSGIRLARS